MQPPTVPHSSLTTSSPELYGELYRLYLAAYGRYLRSSKESPSPLTKTPEAPARDSTKTPRKSSAKGKGVATSLSGGVPKTSPTETGTRPTERAIQHSSVGVQTPRVREQKLAATGPGPKKGPLPPKLKAEIGLIKAQAKLTAAEARKVEKSLERSKATMQVENISYSQVVTGDNFGAVTYAHVPTQKVVKTLEKDADDAALKQGGQIFQSLQAVQKQKQLEAAPTPPAPTIPRAEVDRYKAEVEDKGGPPLRAFVQVPKPPTNPHPEERQRSSSSSQPIVHAPTPRRQESRASTQPSHPRGVRSTTTPPGMYRATDGKCYPKDSGLPM